MFNPSLGPAGYAKLITPITSCMLDVSYIYSISIVHGGYNSSHIFFEARSCVVMSTFITLV